MRAGGFSALTIAGIILYMRPANERRRYIVTPSLIGWAHTQNDPCNSACYRCGTLSSPIVCSASPHLSCIENMRPWTYIYLTATWWRHQIETFSASLALCAGNSPVTGEFPSQRAGDAEPRYFLWSAPEQAIVTPMIWYAIALIMMSL